MATSKKKKKNSAKKKKSTTKVAKKSTNKKKSTTSKSSNTKSTKNKKVSTAIKKEKDNNKKVDLPVLKEKNKPKLVKVKKVEDIKKEVVLPKEKKNNIIIELKKKLFKKKNKSNALKIKNAKKNNAKKRLDKLVRKIKMYGIKSVIPKKYFVGSIIGIISIVLIILVILIIPPNGGRIDLQLIPSNVDYLNTVAFDINQSNDIITSSKAYNSLKEYYEYDFEKVFNLNKDYVSEYFIKYNKDSKQAFIAIKPKENEHEKVEETFNKFFASINVKNYEYLNYQGYLIYINSSNNALVKSKVMQTQIRVFNILKTLSKEDIEKELGIEDKYYDEALVKTSMVIATDTCEYVIFKPKNNIAKKYIKDAMDKYYEKLENKWKDKNNDNYNLVANRLEKEYSGYLIYIVSHDNDLAMLLIQSY